MTINERRENFKRWARNTVMHIETVDGYIKSLDDDLPQKLNIATLFTITDITKLLKYKQNCKKGNYLYSWSDNIGNGRPMASLGKYIDYLQQNNTSVNKGLNIQTPISDIKKLSKKIIDSEFDNIVKILNYSIKI